MCTLFRIFPALLLAALAAPSWSEPMDRAQAEASASILMRDVAAGLCVNAQAGSAGLAGLPTPTRGSLRDAAAVFGALGYERASIVDLDARLQALPSGPQCRAEVLSMLWQHFTSPGRRRVDADAANAVGNESITVTVTGVGTLPRLPVQGEQSASVPDSPAVAVAASRRAASAPASEFPADGTSPVEDLPAAATAPLPPITPGAPQGDGSGGDAVAASTPSPAVAAKPSIPDRPSLFSGPLAWLGAAILVVVAVFGSMRVRRARTTSSAQRARDRLRPT